MKKEEIMDAIGNISDKYVVEFSEICKRRKPIYQNSILRYVAACLVLVCAVTFFLNIIKRKPIKSEIPQNPSTDNSDDVEIAAPTNFHFDGKDYVISPEKICVTEIPEGYHYVGYVTDVGDTYPKRNLEGNAEGDVYISEDGETAYFAASILEKKNGKTTYTLCIHKTKK